VVRDIELWKIWWIAGAPLVVLMVGMVFLAEKARYAGYPSWGDLLDVMRFLLYFAWSRFAWRCSRNVDWPVWTPLARGILAAGLIFSAML
jgi:hypothetical protein